MSIFQKKSFRLGEVLFHSVFMLVVFLFYSFDRNNPQIEFYEFVFFLNYACAAYILNFLLIPKFIYQKKYLSFSIYFLALLICVILIEELVIEQIYFPDTRGSRFSNILYTLIDILPPIIILAGFKLAWDATAKQRQLDELKVMVQESELQFLKSQINPHFLFNNMNNLYAHAVEKSDKTPEIILALSSILRYMLYECKSEYVSLQKEIEQLENFVQLGELQIEGRGIVQFKNHIKPSGFQIAPLILMVFVENAFKHSASSVVDNIYIEIDLKLTEHGKLEFKCKNSFQQQTNIENLTKGIGLANVKKRLNLVYPKAYKLDISDSENSFEVNLTLQLKETTA